RRAAGPARRRAGASAEASVRAPPRTPAAVPAAGADRDAAPDAVRCAGPGAAMPRGREHPWEARRRPVRAGTPRAGDPRAGRWGSAPTAPVVQAAREGSAEAVGSAARAGPAEAVP